MRRRSFIHHMSLGAAGIALQPSFANTSKNAAVNKLVLSLIGCGGRGLDVLSGIIKENENLELKYLCDVNETLTGIKTAIDKYGKIQDYAPKFVSNMKQVFDDKDVDAVVIATPEHWHTLATIWALQAGKHVFVEKNPTLSIWEGRKMIEAARKYDRRVQVGFQNRSIPEVMAAMKFLHDGGIGKIYMARGVCIKPRDSFGIAKDSTPPAGFHYERWLGPATWRAYNEKRSHYNWHWFWDTGNGDTGNQGPHQFDVARWGLNKNEHPVSVYSNGGIFGWSPDQCAQETPDKQSTIAKYKDGTILEFETRGRPSNGESSLDIRIGNVFFGTEGYLELNGSIWKAFRNRETKPFAGSNSGAGNETISLSGPSEPEHFVNFIDALRSGKDETLHCDINEGFYSTTVPLLANISYRLGREVRFMGADMDNEMIINDPEANAMLTRVYRPPYVVPGEV